MYKISKCFFRGPIDRSGIPKENQVTLSIYFVHWDSEHLHKLTLKQQDRQNSKVITNVKTNLSNVQLI